MIVVALAAAAGRAGEAEKVEDLSAFMQEYLGPVADRNAFTFAVISDTHVGSDGAEENLRPLLADIAKAKVDFVIDTGDMTEGKAEQAAKLKGIFAEICGPKIPLLAVMGNHDRDGVDVLRGLYGIEPVGPAASGNYSVNVGRLHLAVVHNGQRELLHPTNAKFLAADLPAAKGRPTLLFYHIHVLCPTPGQSHLSYMGDKRYAALALLNRFDNLKGCFAGHDHAFWAGRFEGKNFFSTVGSWYQCGGTKNGWWQLTVDGETITVHRRQIGAAPEPMPAWEKFPPHPTAAAHAVAVSGRTEIPLFADRLTAAGYYWGAQGQAAGPAEGVAPVAGERMARCTELSGSGEAVLGCEDFQVAPGDRLAYWMYVPPGGGQFTYGLRLGGGWRGGEKLPDANGLPAYLCPDKAGISPGNWLYREIPLGKV
ncbi:MAG TPA: metallophosphoesterase, partial [Phycisphaerae bacterium]|nr:metallophosphoesterase [Phycisphaerae bacterium]